MKLTELNGKVTERNVHSADTLQVGRVPFGCPRWQIQSTQELEERLNTSTVGLLARGDAARISLRTYGRASGAPLSVTRQVDSRHKPAVCDSGLDTCRPRVSAGRGALLPVLARVVHTIDISLTGRRCPLDVLLHNGCKRFDIYRHVSILLVGKLTTKIHI